MWWFPLVAILFWAVDADARQPCEDYPAGDQLRCQQHWKQINQESEAEMAAFGLRQLERRQKGTITAEQHLSENMAFIQASGEKRLKLLRERMHRR